MQDEQDAVTTSESSNVDEKVISWKTFGPFLARARRARGLSQEKLAARLGCDRTHIWRLEHAECRPSRMFLNHLALALTLTAEEAARLKGYTLMLAYRMDTLELE